MPRPGDLSMTKPSTLKAKAKAKTKKQKGKDKQPDLNIKEPLLQVQGEIHQCLLLLISFISHGPASSFSLLHPHLQVPKVGRDKGFWAA